MTCVGSSRRTVLFALALPFTLACCGGSSQADVLPADGPLGDGPVVGDGPRSDGPRPQQDKRLGDLPYLHNKLTFNESLCAAIGNGTKKSTLRNGTYWSLLVVGEWVKLECTTSKTTYKGQITGVRVTTWGGITAEEYMADGFSSQAQMMQIMQTYYNGITLSDPATVIRWDNTSPYP